MTHFITMLDAHVRSTNIEQSWILLEQEFKSKGKSIDSIYDAHMSYLNRIMIRWFWNIFFSTRLWRWHKSFGILRSFLNKKAERVQVLFQDVFDLVSSFCQMVLTGDYKSDGGKKKIQKVFDNFKKKEGFLSTGNIFDFNLLSGTVRKLN